MSKPSLNDVLTDSRPETLSSDSAVRHRLAEMVTVAKPRARDRAQFWRRKRVLLPAAALLILGTTAGGVALMWAQISDVIIPVSYVTDTGKTIECTFAVSAGAGYQDGSSVSNSSEGDALRDFMKSNDWTGLGQSAYERAIDSAWTPSGGMLGEAPFNRAVTEVIGEQILESLQRDGVGWGAGSDCSGQLH